MSGVHPRLAIALRASDPAERLALRREARARGFVRFVVPPGEPTAPSDDGSTYRRTPAALERVTGDGVARVPIVTVREPGDLAAAVRAGRADGAVALEWTAERVLPLENLVAVARGAFPVWAIVEAVSDVPAMLGALEHGADVVVVPVSSPAELDGLVAAAGPAADVAIPWELLPVTRRAAVGIGDRVIVDTTAMLRPEEGMLVGSAAAVLFHVASEAEGSRFTRPRPFRVNAGAAHSYLLMADGSTRYLAELAPGDAVAVTTPRGGIRSVRVGRLKIERRPLVLIEAERAGRRYTVFLQEAETVRLSGETERSASTAVRPGARVFGAAFPPARHLGGVVEETIDER